MIGSLLSRVSAALGKAYLFAGLLPAGVLLLGIFWYSQALDQLPKLVTGLGEQASSPAATILLWLLGWMVLGLVLFAIRGPTLALFQTVPSTAIGRYFLNRKVHRREKVDRKRQELEWQYTVARWHENNFAPSYAQYRPGWIKMPSEQEALTSSRRARAVIQDHAARFRLPAALGERKGNQVLRGLTAVYLWADRTTASETQHEIAEWIALRNRVGVLSIFTLLTERTERRWRAVQKRHEHFPTSLWVLPTDLGNRMAALDDYALKRYGMDTGALWGRIWWVLPKDVRSEVGDSKLAVDTLLSLMLTFALLAFVPLPDAGRWLVNAFMSSRYDLTGVLRPAASFAACLVLAFLAYRAAIIAIDAMSREVATLIDLYRLHLLAALGYRPATIAAELALFEKLQGFFIDAGKRDPEQALTIKFDWLPGGGGGDKSEDSEKAG